MPVEHGNSVLSRPNVDSGTTCQSSGTQSPNDYDRPVSNRQFAAESFHMSGGIQTESLPEFDQHTFSLRRSESYDVRRGEEKLQDAWFGSHGTALDRSLANSRQQMAEMVMEVVIGEDDRKKVVRTSGAPYRGICSLIMTSSSGRRYLGTGWLVDRNTVITAGHNVFMQNEGGWVREVQVMPGRNGNPTHTYTSHEFHSVVGWTEHARAASDYGAIILNQNADFDADFEPYNYSDTDLTGATVYVVGYPGDKPRGTMWGHSRSILKLSEHQLIYDVDTYGGNSGCPVFVVVDGRYRAVGIHNYGDLAGNSATRITSRVLQNIETWRRR